jgi:hyperosmotically inducible protein
MQRRASAYSAEARFYDVKKSRKDTEMNLTKSLKLIGVSTLVVIGLAACDKPGPAETAGKNIDRSVDQVGQKIGETADKVGDKMSEQSAKAGVAIDDTEITTKIKAAFFAESGLKTLQISVDTVKGVVTLSGSVDTQSHSDMAKAMASAVSGVSRVNNDLKIKSGK